MEKVIRALAVGTLMSVLFVQWMISTLAVYMYVMGDCDPVIKLLLALLFPSYVWALRKAYEAAYG